MMNWIQTLTKAVFPLWMLCLCLAANAQNYQVEFGKNRVQHHKFTWFEYETDNFVVYWSGETRAIAHTAVQIAEWDYADIRKILEHRMRQKIEIIVYEDMTDLKQSNIGNDEVLRNTGGQTKIVETKVFVHYDGDHASLRKQIREGIAKVYLNNMLFGDNFQEVVQNAVLLNLPEWFTEGLAGFVGEKWNTDLDNQLRDVIASGKYKDFSEFSQAKPRLAGHSLWYYLDMNYGQSSVSNLIYLTRINRSVGAGFLYVLSSPYHRVLEDWQDYFNERYNSLQWLQTIPPDEQRVAIKNKRNSPIFQALTSPDGQQILYATNEQGRQRVFLQDLQTGKRELLFKTGFRNNIQATDYNYPLLAWAPNGQVVGMIYEKRDVLYFLQIDIATKEKTTQEFAPKYQRVYSMQYLNNNDLVVAAAMNGISDVFIYHINQRSTDRVTDDFYDEKEVAVVEIDGEKGILFTSNRGDDLSLAANGLDSIIPFGTFDVYFHRLSQKKELIRITDSPLANESCPMAWDSSHYAYLSDQNGVRNRYVGELEEYLSHKEKVLRLKEGGKELVFHPDSMPDIPQEKIDSQWIRPIYKTRGANQAATSYLRNINSAHASAKSGKVVEKILYAGEHRLYVSSITLPEEMSAINTVFRQQIIQQNKKTLTQKKEQEKLRKKKKEAQQEKPATWQFESGLGDTNTDTLPAPQPARPAAAKRDDAGFVFITDYLEQQGTPPAATQPDSLPPAQETPIDLDNYVFEDDFGTEIADPEVLVEEDQERYTIQSPKNLPPSLSSQAPQKKVYRFYTPNILAHRRQFRSNNVTVQFDNSPLFGGLEPYTGGGPFAAMQSQLQSLPNTGNFKPANPPRPYIPIGVHIRGTVQDLFEDYELEGGIRIPVTFNGLEMYATLKDEKGRLDKHYSYYRRQIRHTFEDIPAVYPWKIRYVSNLLQAKYIYPLDIYSSFRGHLSGRFENAFLTSSDAESLAIPDDKSQRFTLGLEYVFDNTLELDVNLMHGTRLKVFAEVNQSTDVDLSDGVEFNLSDGVMTLLGVDARHYQRLGKHLLLAIRATAATSFGSDRVLFYVGGADNEAIPRFDDNIPLPDPQNSSFAYQMQATSLRGFRTNIRNGNSFAIGNAELRMPLFKPLYKKPIRSAFLRYFQLVGFVDVGTAWRGTSPFSNDNPINLVEVSNNDPNQLVVLNVEYYRDPIVMGVGGGIRTKMFGYFIRLDYAKGYETKEWKDGLWHFSIGTDF